MEMNIAKFLLSGIVVSLIGCEQAVSPQDKNENAGESYSSGPEKVFVNPNRHPLGQTEANALQKTNGLGWGIMTDASGKVQTQIWECTTYGNGARTATCSVASDQVLIGGGAWADYGNGAGALLTASYPQNNALTTWVGSAKDHGISCSYTLHVYSIGLKLSGVSYSTLWNNMYFTSATSTADHAPSINATLPAGYSLIGGGAKSNYQGNGQLLTASYPQNLTTWTVSAKDHKYADVATITAYAIGIKTTIPNFGSFTMDLGESSNYVSSGYAEQSRALITGYVPACMGGHATWNGQGRLLTKMAPSTDGSNNALAGTKDHLYADGGFTYVNFIQFKKL